MGPNPVSSTTLAPPLLQQGIVPSREMQRIRVVAMSAIASLPPTVTVAPVATSLLAEKHSSAHERGRTLESQGASSFRGCPRKRGRIKSHLQRQALESVTRRAHDPSTGAAARRSSRTSTLLNGRWSRVRSHHHRRTVSKRRPSSVATCFQLAPPTRHLADVASVLKSAALDEDELRGSAKR